MSKGSRLVEKARTAVRQCRLAEGDHEAAHGYKDAAYENGLKAIARGYSDPQGLAKELLKLEELDIQTWCG